MAIPKLKSRREKRKWETYKVQRSLGGYRYKALGTKHI